VDWGLADMSKQVDITKSLSEEDATYLTVFERRSDIARAKAIGTWPEGFALKTEAEEAPVDEVPSENTDVPEQGDDESNGDYAHRLTVPQLREVASVYGNEEEQAAAPAESAPKAKHKAHVIAILDRIDREALETEK
jgi:hypothetical protein